MQFAQRRNGAALWTCAVMMAILLISGAVQAAKFTIDSVDNVPDCKVPNVLQWGLCFTSLRDNVTSEAQDLQALWDAGNATERAGIEREFYCDTLRNKIALTASCIQVCTNDDKDYFDRGQLLDWCRGNVSVAEFATYSSFDSAVTAYSCSNPAETCESLINAELKKTLDKSGSISATLGATGSILIILATFLSF